MYETDRTLRAVLMQIVFANEGSVNNCIGLLSVISLSHPLFASIIGVSLQPYFKFSISCS